LKDFFERVKNANLSLKPSKCKIGFDKVEFLGHTIEKDSIRPQIESIGRILDTDRPKTKKACRSLIGMVDCFLRFYRAEFPVLYDKFMACVGCMNTQIYRPKCLVPFIGCDNLSNTVDKSRCNVVL